MAGKAHHMLSASRPAEAAVRKPAGTRHAQQRASFSSLPALPTLRPPAQHGCVLPAGHPAAAVQLGCGAVYDIGNMRVDGPQVQDVVPA